PKRNNCLSWVAPDRINACYGRYIIFISLLKKPSTIPLFLMDLISHREVTVLLFAVFVVIQPVALRLAIHTV
ncbi:MAG: hypothetical protein ACNS64_05595, partial [Candidatus Halalkalibacterium sp. M3_1C_030]